MIHLTDVDYQKCYDAALAAGRGAAKLGDWFDQAMRRGIDKALALADAPEQPDPTCEHCDFGDGRSATATPCCDCPNNRVSQFKPQPAKLDRAGHWFRDPDDGQIICIVGTEADRHWFREGAGVFMQLFIDESDLVANYERIPPPPPGVDLEGWQCRKPVRGDRYHPLNGDGTSRSYTSEAPAAWDHPIFGFFRWIEPQPAKLDRTEQWFKDVTVTGALLAGPVVLSKDGLHRITTPEGDVHFSEQNIIDGALVRIPPPPEGVDVTVKGWDCRKPVKGERWYSRDGTLADLICPPWDDDDYGMNRWIPPQPAKRPWPVGPFKVKDQSPGLWNVCDANRNTVCGQSTKAEADAIALTLDLLPRLADWASNRCMIAPQEGRDLVAELAAAGFKMPKL